jgi:glycosyltransferase involved in cell wall biosynthesis
MRISVVTISYNQAKYLPSCIESVLAQDGVDVEYIVVDALSSDGSADVIERYRPRLARVIGEKDRGPPDGLNKGFAAATGDIFYYLNADDVIYPGTFKIALAQFQKHPRVDVIYADGEMIDEHDNVIRKIHSLPGITSFSHAVGATTILQQATFLRRDAFARTQGFNIANRSCWDGELVQDLLLSRAKFRHFKGNWAGFRVHAGSISGSNRLAEIYRTEQSRLFEAVAGRRRYPIDVVSQYALRGLGKAQRLLTITGGTA